jgi:hypothetical protein
MSKNGARGVEVQRGSGRLALALLAISLSGCLGGAPRRPGERPQPQRSVAPAQASSPLPETVSRALRESAHLDLVAVIWERDPDPGEANAEGYPERGRIRLDARSRARVLEALNAAVGPPGPLTLCFEPHHALVAADDQGPAATLLFGFSCDELWVRGPASDDSPAAPSTFALASGLEPLLNELLGQETSAPPNWVAGRSVAGWARRLRAERRRAAGAEPTEAGAEAVRALGHALTEVDDPALALLAARALGGAGAWAAPAAAPLTWALTRGTLEVRVEAARTLGQIGEEGLAGVPALERALRAPAPLLRRVAARSLGRIGPIASEALPSLRGALDDSDPEVREAAARAIEAILIG